MFKKDSGFWKKLGNYLFLWCFKPINNDFCSTIEISDELLINSIFLTAHKLLFVCNTNETILDNEVYLFGNCIIITVMFNRMADELKSHGFMWLAGYMTSIKYNIVFYHYFKVVFFKYPYDYTTVQ